MESQQKTLYQDEDVLIVKRECGTVEEIVLHSCSTRPLHESLHNMFNPYVKQFMLGKEGEKV